MSASLMLSWREGITAALAGEGEIVIAGSPGRILLREVPPVILDAFCRLNPPGEDEELLVNDVDHAGNGALAKWFYYIQYLSRQGILCQCVQAEGKRLATLVPVSRSYNSRPASVAAEQCYVLSRFTYMRRQRDVAVLESPLAHARIVLNDCKVGAIVTALAAPCTMSQLKSLVAGFSAEGLEAVATLLLRADLLTRADAEGKCAEDNDPALQTWAFHDLLFHARSRRGRFDAPYGGTFRFAGRLDPPPAVKNPHAGSGRDLARPDLQSLEHNDPSLAWVQEQRRSIREYDKEEPITDRQLGEFLFRVARVQQSRHAEVTGPNGSVCLEFTSRPYPAGGGLYELEFYVAVRACSNLDEGLYHYDPLRHSITQICGRTADVDKLLRDVAQSATIPEADLQVLIILAARVPRVAWKYESIAYALTLKHVGVVFQNMYLTATAMKLAPCAIGGGDADLFSRATGAEYWAETSVGEFLLGSRRLSELTEGTS